MNERSTDELRWIRIRIQEENANIRNGKQLTAATAAEKPVLTDNAVDNDWQSRFRLSKLNCPWESHYNAFRCERRICETQTTQNTTIKAKTISSNQDVITITFNTDSAVWERLT